VATRPIAILIAALGGEGGGVLAEWLVTVATDAGHPVQSTSIPGVAQRTGATTYYVEIWPEPVAAPDGRQPVLSLLPVPGCIDLVVASELLEAVRTVQNGMVSADRTFLITSVARTLTTIEKMPPGDGRCDSGLLLDVARRHSRRLAAFDMDAAARAAGTVVSAVMLGAIAASDALPFGRDRFEAVIRASGRGADASLAGFRRAWEIMQQAEGGAVAVPAASPAEARPTGAGPHPAEAGPTGAEPSPKAAFPAEAQDFVQAGFERVVRFQDRDYADLYLQRLAAVLAAEERSDPQRANGHALTRETARFLALWMAFDDIVRVADLKCRASRFARVRREVGADERDVVRIVDYFRPGVPELSSLLPPPLARSLVAWDARRRAAGKGSWSMALALATDSVPGFLALRTLASLRWLRRRSARFAEEQALIERWLSEIVAAAALDWRLAHEIALCGRLIKGYGATSERGKENLLHILDHVAGSKAQVPAAQRVQAVRDAREAALAEEGGQALDQALARHGAPPRPVKPQPIRWMPKPRGARSSPSGRTP